MKGSNAGAVGAPEESGEQVGQHQEELEDGSLPEYLQI